MNPTATPTLPIPGLSGRIASHINHELPLQTKRWQYFRNPPVRVNSAELPAQAQGLPARLQRSDGRSREIVIENDIAWRVHTLVDFMFGKPIEFNSQASDPDRAALIRRFLTAVMEVNGGANLLQDMAVLGTVYGHVDLMLRVRGGGPFNLADPVDAASRFVVEPVDARRGIPVLADNDYRLLRGYALRVGVASSGEPSSLIDRVKGRLFQHAAASAPAITEHRLQVWDAQQVIDLIELPGGKGYRRVGVARNRLGRVPIVHIQNLPQPLSYSGLSEVEPLIPLQDELNTRLSDRANRITMQAFKMYLGKGIEQFTERPIAPGQMWQTDNPDASIQAFGGDSESPTEASHISDIRDAMDKTSGVSPVAAGVLRNKVGNLSSQNAVRLVLMGLLARVERKRVTYGAGLQRLCEMILHAADVYGVLPNRPDERRVRIDWPNPIPENQREQIELAQSKIELGVPKQVVLNELGYGDVIDQKPQQEEA